MAPRRTTRSTVDQEIVNATTVTNAQLQIMIDQGVTAALAARDALRSMNGDDSHNSGTGVRRTERAARECTYTDFLKCQPLPFKGTEGVARQKWGCHECGVQGHFRRECPKLKNNNNHGNEPIEDQPLPANASPTALSPGYVVDFDPEKDKKDPKEDPADYPADRGDNDDNESSNDDDDDDDIKSLKDNIRV
nr:hypothetical protein [Tanacetum cinerariifolium]